MPGHTRPGRLLVGTSGYAYPHWRGPFYPADLPRGEWLRFYATRFPTVELNNPFYRLPEPRAFRAWQAAVPPGFVFAVKASRFLTHVKRLSEPDAPLRRFLSRARHLGDRLGPVLFQLSGTFHLDLARLDGFLRALARQRLVPGLRAVLEVRHASWLDRAATERLCAAGVALGLADWPELPVAGPLTADFVYLRRHGTAGRYAGSYGREALRDDARRIRGWLRDGRDVFAYFNNDAEAHAARDARRLVELCGAGPPSPGGPIRARARDDLAQGSPTGVTRTRAGGPASS